MTKDVKNIVKNWKKKVRRSRESDRLSIHYVGGSGTKGVIPKKMHVE